LSELIVADAGPLIGLARGDWLWLLQRLYRRVLIPPAVRDELELEAPRPGSSALFQATQDGWLVTATPPERQEKTPLAEILDPGEAEAILLAEARGMRLLIDERRGRAVARRRGVTVIGTGGVLLRAKQAGLVEELSPILDQLATHGYRLSPRLRKEILSRAGEVRR
jgi:predicted nucleic acid-binding protein